MLTPGDSPLSKMKRAATRSNLRLLRFTAR